MVNEAKFLTEAQFIEKIYLVLARIERAEANNAKSGLEAMKRVRITGAREIVHHLWTKKYVTVGSPGEDGNSFEELELTVAGKELLETFRRAHDIAHEIRHTLWHTEPKKEKKS